MIVLGCAMTGLLGVVGALMAAALLALRKFREPPGQGVWRISIESLSRPMWLDSQRVVLQNPYRVIYSDELCAAQFCELRRRCLGLPA